MSDEIKLVKLRNKATNKQVYPEVNSAAVTDMTVTLAPYATIEYVDKTFDTIVDVNNKIAAVNTSITAEETRATAVENEIATNLATVTTDLSAEKTRAITAEGTLTVNLATVSANLEAEITRATDREDDLSKRIEAVAEAENTTETRLLAEETRAKASEATITATLTAEISRAEAAEKVLSDEKQDKLTAGTNIVLTGATISTVEELSDITSIYSKELKDESEACRAHIDLSSAVRTASLTLYADATNGGNASLVLQGTNETKGKATIDADTTIDGYTELTDGVSVTGTSHLNNTKIGCFDKEGKPIFDYVYTENDTIYYPNASWTTALHSRFVANKKVTKDDLKFLTTSIGTYWGVSSSKYGFCAAFINMYPTLGFSASDRKYYWSEMAYLNYDATKDTAYLLIEREVGGSSKIYPIITYKNIASETADLSISFSAPLDSGEQWTKYTDTASFYYPYDGQYHTPYTTNGLHLENRGGSTTTEENLKNLFWLTGMTAESATAERGSIDVTGTAKFYNEADFYNSVDFNNADIKNVEKLTAHSIDTDGNIYSGGKIEAKGTAEVGSIKTGAIEADGEVAIDNAFKVSGTANFAGDVKIASSETVDGTLRSNGDLVSHKIKPLDNNTYDIGNNKKYYKDIYVGGNLVTYDGTTIDPETGAEIPNSSLTLELPKENGKLVTETDIASNYVPRSTTSNVNINIAGSTVSFTNEEGDKSIVIKSGSAIDIGLEDENISFESGNITVRADDFMWGSEEVATQNYADDVAATVQTNLNAATANIAINAASIATLNGYFENGMAKEAKELQSGTVVYTATDIATIDATANSAVQPAALTPYATIAYVDSAVSTATVNMATTGDVLKAVENMATVSYVDNAVLNMATTGYVDANIASATLNMATVSYVDTEVAKKQDTISDLATIKSGAALGATAVQPEALTPYVTTATLTAELAKKQDNITSTNKLDYSLIANTPSIPSIEGLATVDQVTSATLNMATTGYVDTSVSSAVSGLTTTYATISYVNEEVAKKQNTIMFNSKPDNITKSEVLNKLYPGTGDTYYVVSGGEGGYSAGDNIAISTLSVISVTPTMTNISSISSDVTSDQIASITLASGDDKSSIILTAAGSEHPAKVVVEGANSGYGKVTIGETGTDKYPTSLTAHGDINFTAYDGSNAVGSITLNSDGITGSVTETYIDLKAYNSSYTNPSEVKLIEGEVQINADSTISIKSKDEIDLTYVDSDSSKTDIYGSVGVASTAWLYSKDGNDYCNIEADGSKAIIEATSDINITCKTVTSAGITTCGDIYLQAGTNSNLDISSNSVEYNSHSIIQYLHTLTFDAIPGGSESSVTLHISFITTMADQYTELSTLFTDYLNGKLSNMIIHEHDAEDYASLVLSISKSGENLLVTHLTSGATYDTLTMSTCSDEVTQL